MKMEKLKYKNKKFDLYTKFLQEAKERKASTTQQ